MPFNGNGQFDPASPQYPAIPGTVILAADWNTIVTDIAAGLSLAWTRDGQAGALADLSMGGFKLRAVATALSGTDAVNLTQATVNVTLSGATFVVTATTVTLPAGTSIGTVSATEILFLDGVTSALQTQLDAKQPLDSDLTAVAGLATTGMIARTGSGTAAVRTITGTGPGVTVTNGDGVAGNPTVSLNPGIGFGDVLGPASAVNNQVVFFDGTTGKAIKDSGLALSGSNTGDQTSIVGITGTLAQFNTAVTDANLAVAGAVGSSAITMSTNRLLGRGTAGTGAIEEITLGTGLSFTATTLNGTSPEPILFYTLGVN